MSALSSLWTSEKPVAKPSRMGNLFTTLLREIEIRRALRAVGSLDDATLLDMGLDRGGLEDAVRCGRR